MVGSRVFSCVRIGLAALGCMGAVRAWDGPLAPQSARVAPPAVDKGAGATNADAAWKKAGADEGLRQAFERATCGAVVVVEGKGAISPIAADCVNPFEPHPHSGASIAHRLTIPMIGMLFAKDGQERDQSPVDHSGGCPALVWA